MDSPPSYCSARRSISLGSSPRTRDGGVTYAGTNRDGVYVSAGGAPTYSALTYLEYDLTFTDTVTGRQRTYHNPNGTYATNFDSSAF